MAKRNEDRWFEKYFRAANEGLAEGASGLEQIALKEI
jgi:hypothetical protein